MSQEESTLIEMEKQNDVMDQKGPQMFTQQRGWSIVKKTILAPINADNLGSRIRLSRNQFRLKKRKKDLVLEDEEHTGENVEEELEGNIGKDGIILFQCERVFFVNFIPWLNLPIIIIFFNFRGAITFQGKR